MIPVSTSGSGVKPTRLGLKAGLSQTGTVSAGIPFSLSELSRL